MKANPPLKNSIDDVESDTKTTPENTDFFKLVFENSSTAKSITRPDGRITVNQAFCDMLGYSKDEMVNQKWAIITHPEDIEESKLFIAKVLNREQNTAKFEKRYIHKNGTIIWVAVSTYLQRDSMGEPLFFITDIFDITERKQMETALVESETRFGNLLQNVESISVQGYSADGTTQYWNKASEQLYGYTANEAIGKNLLELIIPPEMRADVAQAVQYMVETGQSIPSSELSLMRKDGSHVAVYSSHAIINLPGKPPELFCIDIDLTERKKNEQAFAKSQAELKAIYENSPVMMCVVDENRKIQYANPAFTRLTGTSEDSLKGGHACGVFGCINALTNPRGCGFGKNCESCGLRQAMEDTLSNGVVHKNIEYNTTLLQNGICKDVSLLGSTVAINTSDQKYLLLCLLDITERKQAQKALGESEANLMAVFNASDESVLLISSDESIITLNEVAAKRLGRTQQSIIGQNVSDFLPPDVIAHRRPYIQQVLATGKPVVFDDLRNGRWMTNHIFPIPDQDGNVSRLAIFARDITDRIQAENALLKSEELMSLFMKHSPIYAFIKQVNSTESRVLKASENYIDMIGIKGSEMVGKTMEELFPPEFAKAISLDDWKVVSDGKILKLEEKLNDRYYITFKYPILHGDGNFLAGYTIDITELKQTERALRKSKQQFDNLAEKIPVGVYVLKSKPDGSYALKYVSPRMAEMLDLSIENLKSESDTIFKAIHPDDVDYVYKLNQERIQLQQPFDWKGRFIVKGKIRWMHISSLPQISETGAIIWHGLIVDITEQIEAEAEIKHQNEALISLNATKDKFFSIIAHDLRSPFSSFLGLTQIMAEELPSLTMAQVQEIAISMSKSAANLYRLIENLLHWARIQQGKIPYNPIPVNLLSLINESTEMMLEPAKSKEIKLIFDIPDQLEVEADINTFQTVMRNLVSNAIKFTRKGGSVIISAKETDDKTAEISVKDSGIGMSQEIIEKLFHIGAQSSRIGTEGEPSTGLGLILCKEFVEKNGGKIWTESEVGKGSTFYITINLAK